ncbi:MAG TPA: substrate-binding domain-containing protein [Terriglobia bacterium]|nr:substrate-binding domain-containing protein [Terriglobia bacterium]
MKTTRAPLVTLALLASFLVTTSCEKAYHEETEKFIFVAANINLPYWQEAKAGLNDAALAMHVKEDFTGPESYDVNQELAFFQSAVASHPTGILLQATRPELFKSDIDKAVQQGIPVVTVDSDAPDSRRLLFLGTDNVRAGVESGKHLAELLHGEGNVVVIYIPGQLNLEERMQGATQALGGYPKIKITQKLDDKGDPRVANDLIGALLAKNEKIDGILCLEASGAPGAAEVLHRLSLEGTITIVGFDKNPETLDHIEDGWIKGTIAQKPYTMAYYGVRFLDDLHHNIVHEFKDWRTAPASPLPTRVDTGTAWVDKSNVAAFRAALASHQQPLGPPAQ